MAGKNDLEIRVGADVRDLEQGMKRAKDQIQTLSKAQGVLSAAFLQGRVTSEQYEKGLNKLNSASNRYNKAVYSTAKSLKGLGGSMSANAIPATQEFSRIIQDAPYGIQGVANNIQQLTAQFGYLATKTGGAKQAVKAMIGSLWGPAGILLAVSAITAALPFLIKAFSKTKDATENLKDAVDDLTTAYKRQIEQEKDSRRGLDIQTKIAVAKAKLLGKSEREILKITNQGVSERVASLGREIVETNKFLSQLTTYRNRAYKIGGEAGLALAEEYDAKITSLVRKNQETQLKIQELGGSLVLAELNTQLSEREKAHSDSVEKIKRINEGIFRDLPSFSGMGVPSFGDAMSGLGGSFSGMFLPMIEDLNMMTQAFNEAMGTLTETINETTEEIGVAVEEDGDKLINFGQMLGAGFSNFGQSIADGLADGTLSISNSGSLFLAAFGDMLSSLGKALIAYGFALLAFEEAFSNPWAAIAAGTAAVVIGGVISKTAKGAYKKVTGAASSGGVGGGGSSSFSGSSSGSVSTGGGGGTYVFEIEGTKLVGVLSNTLNRNKSLGGNLSLG